jgi:hypothetical protein
MTALPPPDVVEAAAKVQAWLDGKAGAATAPAQKPMSAAERFTRRVALDTPAPMPAWKDPRA